MSTFDIEIDRGDGRTFLIALTYAQSNPTLGIDAGDPYPLTDETVWFTGKRKVSDATPVIQKVTGGGGIETTDDDHIVRVRITGFDTKNLVKDTSLICDVQVQAPGEDPVTVAKGDLTILRDVTTEVL
jgi:hypothetical protein